MRTLLAILLACLAFFAGAGARAEKQRTFATPQLAAQALHDAVRADDRAALAAILGPAGRDIVDSGDPAEDLVGRVRFVAAYEEGARIDITAPHRAVLVIGKQEWRFPFPLQGGPMDWHFDTAEGRKEVLARRIGRNELAEIQAVLGYVDAQREYAASAHDGVGPGVYAQRIASTAGRHDGLYWTPAGGEPLSPLGLLYTLAAADETNSADAAPYHGYRFRVLRAQARDARGGAREYVVHGRMMGGFALVAWPARYRVSGVRTFVVNQDGEVFSRDLGARSEQSALAMRAYDPGRGWKREPDFAPASQASEAMRELVSQRGCTLCHRESPTRPGADAATPLAPSLREIASRYRGDPAAEQRLTHTILEGADPGVTHWSARAEFTSMKGSPRVSPDEARAIVRWILSLP